MSGPVDLVNLNRNERQAYLALLEPAEKRDLLKRGMSIYLEETLKGECFANATVNFRVMGIKGANLNIEANEIPKLSLELYLTTVPDGDTTW